MVSVERIKEYEDIIQENVKLGRADEFEGIQNTDDSSQCGQGLIEFDNVTARYPLRFDIILKNVTFQIMPGQHVAIVGRTGSGNLLLLCHCSECWKIWMVL